MCAWSYDASWGGVVEGKPVAGGLEGFGNAVRDWLMAAIRSEFVENEVNLFACVCVLRAWLVCLRFVSLSAFVCLRSAFVCLPLCLCLRPRLPIGKLVRG